MKKNTKIALAVLVALAIIAAVVIILTRPAADNGDSTTDTSEVTEQGTETTAEAAEQETETTSETIDQETETTTETAEQGTEATTETSEDTTAPAQSSAADTLLVTVNGEEIRENSRDLRVWVNYIMSQVGSEPDEATVQLANQYAMENAIRFVTLRQNLEKMGYTFTDEEVEAAKAEAGQEWDDAVEMVMEQVYGVSADASEEDKTAARGDAVAYLQDNSGYTRESYIEEAELNLVYTKAQEMFTKDIALTDEEVEAYFMELVAEDEDLFRSAVMQDYESIGETPSDEDINEAIVQLYEMYSHYYGYESLYMPEGYRGITHILLEVDEELLNNWKELQARLEEQAETDAEATDTTETDPDAEPAATEEPVTQEMVDAARQAILDSIKDKVDEIKTRLEAGESFQDLILEYGTDPGMEDEATRNSGYPVHKASMVYDTDFTNGAMALEKVGDVSEPVISQFGVHILYYLRDIPGGPVELTDELKSSLHDELMNDRLNSVFSDAMDQWVNESEIVWTEAGEPWKLPAEETAEETTGADE